MSQYQISIFNDVLGPVMTGPSSSHTAGPGRIGYFIGKLMDSFEYIKIEFPQKGSYAGTYKGQKSDVAIVAGLLGMEIIHPKFKDSLAILEEKNISLEIVITDYEAEHPNSSIITLKKKSGEQVSVESWSTGGGMFVIRSINGISVTCKGDYHELVVLGDTSLDPELSVKLEQCLKSWNIVSVHKNICVTKGVSNIKLSTEPSKSLISTLSNITESCGGKLRYIPPILPVATGEEKILPFETADELEKYLFEHEMPLWQAAVTYEAVRSGWSEKQVLSYAEYLLGVMKKSIQQGLAADFQMSGFLSPTAYKIEQASNNEQLIDTGVIGKGTIYSTAVMEYNSALGQVVASPTAGSCGVLPGTIFALIGINQEDLTEAAKALMCAGLIGVFIAKQATFAAEVCGCQAEIGSASCMAAALVCHFMSIDAKISLKAASMAMQNTLGLICDPVAGCVEIPCINRNAMAVSNAIVCANLAVGGFDPVISLDEVILAMYKVGKMLPRELRCTGLGGLCDTVKAKELKLIIKKKFAN